MGILASRRVVEKAVREWHEIGECVLEDLGQVEISLEDYVPRGSKLVCSLTIALCS